MPYRSPVSDYEFIFKDIVPMEPIRQTSKFEDAQEDVVSAVLSECGKLCEEVMAPLQRPGDLHPAKLE
ncbi:MAG: acyl-CoA dehydrogenase, partial [Planctomycetota bacterium]